MSQMIRMIVMIFIIGGYIMSNRKPVTVSLDADLWRKFKSAVVLMAGEPSTLFEQFMAVWLRKNETRIIEMSSLDSAPSE
jgi:hypothetical protein